MNIAIQLSIIEDENWRKKQEMEDWRKKQQQVYKENEIWCKKQEQIYDDDDSWDDDDDEDGDLIGAVKLMSIDDCRRKEAEMAKEREHLAIALCKSKDEATLKEKMESYFLVEEKDFIAALELSIQEYGQRSSTHPATNVLKYGIINYFLWERLFLPIHCNEDEILEMY